MQDAMPAEEPAIINEKLEIKIVDNSSLEQNLSEYSNILFSINKVLTNDFSSINKEEFAADFLKLQEELFRKLDIKLPSLPAASQNEISESETERSENEMSYFIDKIGKSSLMGLSRTLSDSDDDEEVCSSEIDNETEESNQSEEYGFEIDELLSLKQLKKTHSSVRRFLDLQQSMSTKQIQKLERQFLKVSRNSDGRRYIAPDMCVVRPIL